MPREGAGGPRPQPLQPAWTTSSPASTCGGKIRFMAKSQLFGPPGARPTSSSTAASSRSAAATTTRRPSRPPTSCSTRARMLLIYAEGGRSRSRELGEPKPGDRPDRAGDRARRSCRSRSTARPGCARWKRLRFPKVTVQFGEPMTFPVEARAQPRAPARGRRRGLRRGAGDVRGAALLVASGEPGVEVRIVPRRDHRVGELARGRAAAPAVSGGSCGRRRGAAAAPRRRSSWARHVHRVAADHEVALA